MSINGVKFPTHVIVTLTWKFSFILLACLMYRVFHRKCRHVIKTSFYLCILRATLLSCRLSVKVPFIDVAGPCGFPRDYNIKVELL